MMANTVPTGTFSPGWTRNLSITPLVKTSISISAFSVSTSAMMSPRWIRSPKFLRQRKSLPAVMSAPSCGITNSAMARDHLQRRTGNFFHFWQGHCLEMFCVGHRDFGTAHARHRCVQVVEDLFHDLGADFGGKTSGAPRFIYNHCAVRFHYGVENCRTVERSQDAQIDHFRINSFFCQQVRRLHGLSKRTAVGDKGDVLSWTKYRRPADVGCFCSLVNVTLQRV